MESEEDFYSEVNDLSERLASECDEEDTAVVITALSEVLYSAVAALGDIGTSGETINCIKDDLDSLNEEIGNHETRH